MIYVHVNIILDFPITFPNSKHGSFLYKYLPKRESTRANVQSCPLNEKSELYVHVEEDFLCDLM